MVEYENGDDVDDDDAPHLNYVHSVLNRNCAA